MSYLRALSIRQLAVARSLSAGRHATSLPKHATRSFSVSFARAAEIPNKSQLDTVTKALQGSKAWAAIANNDEIQQLFVETAKVLKEEGVDMAKPSMFVMFKNARVRDQIMKLGQAFQASGLDMASMKELAEIAQNALKEEESKK
ncbi:hypothetical protein PsYK624_008020 [Phanerochaete sordida]|uniref:Uncharacterized protein n=1 Tax=Phanerochaete sordida TaxID=48140 RepID=A0A9P3FY47_9APHY|nr:hypothetical protein PsYK624_008020 [Phanerochaete sordida]